MRRSINLSIITSILFGFFNFSHAQIDRPADKLGSHQEAGLRTTLWSDDLKTQMYYVPYLQMDWHYFQSINPEFDEGMLEYCELNSGNNEDEILWKSKFHFWHDGFAESIAESWNNSNSQNIKYQKYFDNGKITPQNISTIPHNRLEIYLNLFFTKDNRSVPIYGEKDRNRNSEVKILTGGEYLPQSIIVPFYASNEDICLWIENKESPILQGMIYFNAIEKDKSSISATQIEKVKADIRAVLNENIVDTYEYEPVDNNANSSENGFVDFAKVVWRAVTTAGSMYAASQGFDPSAAGQLSRLAGDIGDAGIGTLANLLDDNENFEEGEEFIIIMTNSEIIEEYKGEISRRVEVIASSEEMIAMLLNRVDQAFDEALSNNIIKLTMKSVGDSLILSANGRELGSVPGDALGGKDVEFDVLVVSQRSIETSFNSFTDIILKGDLIAMSVPLPVRREDSIVQTAFERDISARLQMVLDQVERELNQAESEVEQTTDMLRERLTDLLPQVDRMDSELTDLKASASDALGAYEKKISDIYTSAVGSIGRQLPIGSVIWWHPVTADELVPEGWAIADGRSVVLSDGREVLTPNLMNRGIIGGSIARVGEAVGSNKVKLDGATEPHKLTVQEMPKHSHEFRVTGAERIGRTIAGTLSQNRGVDTSKTRSLRTMSVGGSQPHSHGLDLQFDNRAASMLLIPLIKL